MSYAPISSESRAGTRTWHVAHVHLPHSRHTPFLVEVIAPLLRAEGLKHHFFFLRYWQGGPHLRLRMLCGPGAGEARAAERVVAGIADAMPEFTDEDHREYRQGLELQEELAAFENEITGEIRPLGTLDHAPYHPEYRKYGGAEGLEIAETVFRESSVAVLELLEARSATTQAPIGEAARIMAMSLHGAGLDPVAASRFLTEYEDWWRKYAPEDVQRAWPKLYQGVAQQIDGLCAAVWNGDGTDDVFHRVSAMATDQARAVCGVAPRTNAGDLHLAGTPYLSCLSNYVHTTNNRLGLLPSIEGLIAYLVRRGIESGALGKANENPSYRRTSATER